MIEQHETYSYPHEEGDDYHKFLTDMKFSFSYTKHARNGISSNSNSSTHHTPLRKLCKIFSCRRANQEDHEHSNEDHEVLIEKFLRGSGPEKPRTTLGQQKGERKEKQKKARAPEEHLKRKDPTNIRYRESEELRENESHYWQFDNDGKAYTTRYDQRKDPLAEVTPIQKLKRKRSVEELGAKKAGFDSYMKQLRAQQRAIYEGTLEQVICPGQVIPQKTIVKPPTPLKPSSLTRSTASKKAQAKDNSPSLKLDPRKLASYVASSADLLDATRRDLSSTLHNTTGKWRPPLAGLDFQSVSVFGRYNHKHIRIEDTADDDDDDKSFSCIGLSETDLRISTPELERARRLSSGGTDPWTAPHTSRTECRICHAYRPPAGCRGLCRACEKAFQRSMKTFEEATSPALYKCTYEALDQHLTVHEPLDGYSSPSPSPSLSPQPSTTSRPVLEPTAKHCVSAKVRGEPNKAPSVASQYGTLRSVEVRRKREEKETGTGTGKRKGKGKGKETENCQTPQRRTAFVPLYEQWQTPGMKAAMAGGEGSRWSESLLK